MSSTARQSKPPRKGGPEPARRAPAWTGARASPTFSPSHTPRPQGSQQSAQNNNFPSLPAPNGPRPDAHRDRVLLSLTGLTGTTVTLTTRTGQRFEGVVGSTNGEGDTTGVTLRDVRDLSVAGAPLRDSLFIASTNIDTYTSGPADSKPTNGDTFRTDTDISGKKGLGRERELQAWVPSADTQLPTTDDDTFGASNNNTSWDQFSANEQLFGVKVNFDEEAYTTKLDRTAPNFKERERQAQRIANEIMGAATNNPHLAEERGQIVDDSGINEEDKYGAVVRGTNAYVPPGARKSVSNGATPGDAPKPDIPKVSVNGPDGTSVASGTSPVPSKTPSPAPNPSSSKPPADPLPAFRDFVTHEKQRLTQKRQALVKSEMDKRMAELVKFSQSFKLNKPIPDDLVPILAKDEDKQKAIREKATRDAQSGEARVIGASTPATASRGVLATGKMGDSSRKPTAQLPASKTINNHLDQPSSSQKPAAAANAATSATPGPPSKPEPAPSTKKISMVIQPIPAFRGAKSRPAAAGPPAPNTSNLVKVTTSNGAGGNIATPLSPSTAARLNVNAPSFRSKGSVSPSLSAASASASPKPGPRAESAPVTPNPFFGHRIIKKSTPVNVKDDFNPFKHNKVVDASAVAAMWPYNGKRYMTLYPPPPPHQPIQHPPHMPPVMTSPMPPQPYEEDPAAQAAAAAARGYVYAYPPYGYPGQPMMPGMPPGPPGAYMQGHFMPPMPYPPGMPPPNAMYSPAMGQMPPPQAYMSPPPGAYPPPPNGGQRPSMPPTPIPAHAHPYYHHQSPQMQHAVPYPMMIPPPGGPPPPHPYDGSQQQQVPMGGHA